MKHQDFIIDYSLFLMTKFNFDRNEATENAKSWWNKLVVEDKEEIIGFRINKNGNPSIQTQKLFISDIDF